MIYTSNNVCIYCCWRPFYIIVHTYPDDLDHFVLLNATITVNVIESEGKFQLVFWLSCLCNANGLKGSIAKKKEILP